jgi:bacterioferritin
MKGSDKIIELLNETLTAEITAVNQYWVHARMCENWGFSKLWEKIRHEAIDEMKHADQIVARILFMDGVPNLSRLGSVKIGQNVPEMLKLDLEVEMVALDRLNKGVAACVELGDNGSRELFERILVDEEEHADWLEAQLELVEQVGVQNYLAAQI